MTHDELLAKIQSDYEDNKHFRDERNWKSFTALRAVVELTDFVLDTEPSQDNKDYNLGYLVAMYNVFKAIEKELQ